ncbi:hypothetical protein GOBAR_DD08578 [Gossypium barbadense]|nr:hypothetical protein GOBAR_DD08578 [Gossypium barbadense]
MRNGVIIEFGDVSGDTSACVTTRYVFLGLAMQKLTRLHSSVSGDASIVSLPLVSGDTSAQRRHVIHVTTSSQRRRRSSF